MHFRPSVSISISVCVVTILVLLGGDRTAATQDPAQRLREANAARAAGQIDEALAIVEAVVAKSPLLEEAVRLRVVLLLDRQRLALALSAYDAYATARRAPDATLLALIATAELHQLAQEPDAALSVAALERLAGAGDTAARRSLQLAAAAGRSATTETLGPLSSLVRLGDKDATTTLGALLTSAPADGKLVIIAALKDAGAVTQAPKIVALLTDADPSVRIAAAQALGALQAREAVPQLQQVFDNDLPSVRIFAAIALKRLGQSSADVFVAGLLASPVPEVRLMAGEAYQSSKTTQWVTRIWELRTDPNPEHRVRVADLLACCDQPTARTLLLEAIRSPNPLLRAEASRVYESRALADASIVRLLLGDSFDLVRLHGAGASLRAVQRASASR